MVQSKEVWLQDSIEVGEGYEPAYDPAILNTCTKLLKTRFLNVEVLIKRIQECNHNKCMEKKVSFLIGSHFPIQVFDNSWDNF